MDTSAPDGDYDDPLSGLAFGPLFIEKFLVAIIEAHPVGNRSVRQRLDAAMLALFDRRARRTLSPATNTTRRWFGWPESVTGSKSEERGSTPIWLWQSGPRNISGSGRRPSSFRTPAEPSSIRFEKNFRAPMLAR
jgi:hypothetical protein